MAATRSGASGEELARAVRLLRLRGRREATGLFSGSSVSPFRGAGLEFEESRPYVPGDDVSSFDWSATARTGQLFVKRHREERSHTLLFALDVSQSMAFRTVGASKAEHAARTIALLTAAAGRAGDRVGLVIFDNDVRECIPAGRGGAHALRVLRVAAQGAATPGGATQLAPAFKALRGLARRRASILLLSDFRDSSLDPPGLRRAVAEIAAHHDVIALPVRDPAEIELPEVGMLRIADPARPASTRLLATSQTRVRTRFRQAAAQRKHEIEQALRHAGAEVQWLRCDQSPLQPLAGLFASRAARRSIR